MTDGIQGFNRRLRKAKRAYELKYDCDLTPDILAAKVSEASGVKKRDSTTVNRWLKKTARPRTWEEMEALAAVLEVRAGWLAFGEGEMTPAAVTKVLKEAGQAVVDGELEKGLGEGGRSKA